MAGQNGTQQTGGGSAPIQVSTCSILYGMCTVLCAAQHHYNDAKLSCVRNKNIRTAFTFAIATMSSGPYKVCILHSPRNE